MWDDNILLLVLSSGFCWSTDRCQKLKTILSSSSSSFSSSFYLEDQIANEVSTSVLIDRNPVLYEDEFFSIIHCVCVGEFFSLFAWKGKVISIIIMNNKQTYDTWRNYPIADVLCVLRLNLIKMSSLERTRFFLFGTD